MDFSHNANNDFLGGKFSALGQTKIGKKLEIFIFRVKLTNFFLKINIDLVENLANFQNN